MKIKKSNVLAESAALHEDDNEPEVTMADIDVATASTNELADAVQGEIYANSGDEVKISDDQAEEIAAEIKPVIKEVGAEEVVITPEDYDSITVENRLTEALDDSLASARYDLRNANYGPTHLHNVLVEGLPGSGKTAIINA